MKKGIFTVTVKNGKHKEALMTKIFVNFCMENKGQPVGWLFTTRQVFDKDDKVGLQSCIESLRANERYEEKFARCDTYRIRYISHACTDDGTFLPSSAELKNACKMVKALWEPERLQRILKEGKVREEYIHLVAEE